MRRLVLAALAVALPLAFQLADPAQADGPVFTLPALRVGDVATYDDGSGLVTVSIGAPTQALDKAARPVEVVPVAYAPSGTTEYFSNRTMTLELVHSSCAAARNPDGSCSMPYQRWGWTQQGAPAVLGATFLQGRSFRVGDAWNVTGDCACSYRTVTIEAPDARSPAGTDFVARIQADYALPGFTGRIHASATSAWPLLVEPAFRSSSRLVSLGAGFTPIAFPAPLEEASYASPLAIVPLDHGRPAEGTPLPGWPSWSAARNATGPDDADATPGARFVSIHVPFARQRTRVDDPIPGLGLVTTYDVQSRFAIPGAPDNVTHYSTVNATLAGVQTPIVYEHATRGTAAASNLGACMEGSVVLWDAARFTLGLPYLHEFNGFVLDTSGPTACVGGAFVVNGQPYPPDGSLAVEEDVALSATQGYLYYAHSVVTGAGS